MSRSGMWTLAGCGVLVALAAAAGCARDIGGSARDVAGPAGGISEGTRMRGTLTGFLQALGPDGTPTERPVPTVAFEARVSDGIARADSVGPIVATSRVLGVTRRNVDFTDREGHQNQVVLTADGAQSPVTHVQHFRDGQLLVEVSYGWDRLPGGWILRDRTFELSRHGRAVLRQHQSSAALRIAGAMGLRDALGLAGASLLGGLDAAPLVAQNLSDCGSEWLVYAGALFVLAAAVERLERELWNPTAWTIVGAAYAGVEKSLDAVVYCETVNYEP